MRTFDLSIPSELTAALAPDIALMVGAMALLLWAAWGRESIRRQRAVGAASMILCAIVAGMVVYFMRMDAVVGPGPIALDGFRWAVDLLLLLATFATIALSMDYNERERITAAESHVLLLLATSGMMVLVSARDLIIVFLGIEIMSVAVYVLAGMNRRSDRAAEGALKYFLLGAFSTCFLLYGIALVYGATGSTNLTTIAERVGQTGPVSPLLLIGMALLVVGFGFKIAAVPFHMWAPDAYEGAPTSVTAFLSTGSKAASFALYARIFFVALAPMQIDWAPLLGIVAALTIVVGNWAAITQENSKRLLAYSSISNAGYLLLGIVANNTYGNIGLFIYLLVYTLMNMGAFGIIISLRRRGIIGDNVDDMTGLAQKAPGMAAMMGIFMLSLGGLPGTGGFIGKYFLLWGLLARGDAEGKTWYYWLAGWAVINIVVSFYYYIRFIRVMYLGDRVADDEPLSMSPALRASLVAALVGILFIGIYPQPFIALAQKLMPAAATVAPAASNTPAPSE